MTMEVKLDMLNKSSSVSASSLVRQHGVNESTIRTIRKSEDKIRDNFHAGASYVSKRDTIFEKKWRKY